MSWDNELQEKVFKIGYALVLGTIYLIVIWGAIAFFNYHYYKFKTIPKLEETIGLCKIVNEENLKKIDEYEKKLKQCNRELEVKAIIYDECEEVDPEDPSFCLTTWKER